MSKAQAEQMTRYLKLPKALVGPSKADALFSIHEQLRQRSTSWTYQFMAGSAAAESALTGSHLSVEERLARLEAADMCWREAQSIFVYRHDSPEAHDARLYMVPDKIEVHRAFVPLFTDITSGHVQPSTLDILHERVLDIGVKNLELYLKSGASGDRATMLWREGFGHEVSTILTVTRLKKPTLLAIPAFARCDNGVHHSADTHDVRLLQQSHGVIRSSTPFEVKTSESPKHSRYRSPIVRGTIELQVPSCDDSLAIVAYMDEERRGTLSPERAKELDEISIGILKLAADYKERTFGKSALAHAS